STEVREEGSPSAALSTAAASTATGKNTAAAHTAAQAMRQKAKRRGIDRRGEAPRPGSPRAMRRARMPERCGLIEVSNSFTSEAKVRWKEAFSWAGRQRKEALDR